MKGIVYPEDEKLEGQPLRDAPEQVNEVNWPPSESQKNMALVKLDVQAVRPTFDRYSEEITRWKTTIQTLEVINDSTATTAAVIGGEAAKAIKAIKRREKEVTEEARNYVAGVKGLVDPFYGELNWIKETAERKISDHKYRQRMEEQKQQAAADRAARELQEKLNREADEANRKAQAEARKLAEQEAERQRKIAEKEAAKRKAGEAELAEMRKKLEEDKQAALKKAQEEEAKNAVVAPTVLSPIIPETKTQIRTETGVTAFANEPWICEIVEEGKVPHEYRKCEPSQMLLNRAVKEGVREIEGCRIYQGYKTKFRTQ